jgi:hypothetical protein
MTRQQRKILLICLAIVVASYIVRSIVIDAMRMAYYQQQAIQRQQAMQRKQAKAKAAPPVAMAPSPLASGVVESGKTPSPAGSRFAKAPPSPSAKLYGIWRGRAALDGRGICDLKFELKEKPGEADRFSGYSSMTCIADAPLMSAKKINPKTLTINRMDPEASILTGVMENGSMEFRADKVVGADSNGCAPTSYTLTPFGANQLAAEWHEATCAGGRMILHKARL